MIQSSLWLIQTMSDRHRDAWNDADKYRRYHEEKAKIPMDLPPQEFEERVKKLARKYKIERRLICQL